MIIVEELDATLCGPVKVSQHVGGMYHPCLGVEE
jgi:hypothetical protein